MLTESIHQIIETFVNGQTADIFTAPLAMFIVFMLLFGLFTIFCDSRTKRIFLICILIIILVFIVFSMASNIGFITLPITLGGIT